MEDYTHRLLKPQPTDRGYGGTIVVLLIAVALTLSLFSLAAFAQTSESTSVSGAVSDVDVRTGAAAGVIINNTGQKAGKDGRVYAEVATAPGLGGLALGGGHPCAFSPATAQVSIIGGGAGIGGSKVDSACMLMIMGAAGDPKAYKAAQYMLASRDPAACKAMEAAGMVDCTTKAEARAAKKDFSAKSTKSASAVVTGRCDLNGKTLHFRPSSGGDRDAELVACKARFGL